MSKIFGSSCVAIHQDVGAEFPKLRKWLTFGVFICQNLFWLDVIEDQQSPDLTIYLKTTNYYFIFIFLHLFTILLSLCWTEHLNL